MLDLGIFSWCLSLSPFAVTRLTFPGELVENGEENATYNISTGTALLVAGVR